MRIFLTGASGFVGGELACRLVNRQHEVTALVRGGKDVLSNDAIPVEGIGLVTGDISEDRLGLSPDEWKRIAASHDLILHCAATTRFDLDDDEYDRVNIGGVRNALELAAAGSLPLLYVSTAYVCGERSGRVSDSDPLPSGGWTNGYERSKALGEKLIGESGLRYAIARPSIVVGSHRTGRARVHGPVYSLFKLLAEGQLSVLPATLDASLAFVPIDFVAEGIVALAERMDIARGAYHLVAPGSIRLDKALGVIAGFADLRVPRIIDRDADLSVLTSREQWFMKHVFRHYGSYITRDLSFEDARFFELAGMRCPASDEAYLRKLIAAAFGADDGGADAPGIR